MALFLYSSAPSAVISLRGAYNLLANGFIACGQFGCALLADLVRILFSFFIIQRNARSEGSVFQISLSMKTM